MKHLFEIVEASAIVFVGINSFVSNILANRRMDLIRDNTLIALQNLQEWVASHLPGATSGVPKELFAEKDGHFFIPCDGCNTPTTCMTTKKCYD